MACESDNIERTVVIVAYACSPKGYSEQWLGWKWAELTAKGAKVLLLTRPDRPGLKGACKNANIELFEIAVPKLIRSATQKLGGIGMWIRINAWAIRVRKAVHELSESRNITYGQLVTFHSAQMPFVFNKCKFVKAWGPVSGMEFVPWPYMKYLGADRIRESLRNLLLSCTRRYIQNKASSYDIVLYGNKQTMRAVEKRRNGVSRLVMPNNLDQDSTNFLSRAWKPGETLRILFVGSCQAQRGMLLVLRSLALLKNFDWVIDIAGTGSGIEAWKAAARNLGINERVFFHGWVDKEKVDSLYVNSHLFIFPSLRDGGGSGMLEAIDYGLPVLALDWGGPADVIGNSKAGHLFPASTPEATIEAFCVWFKKLFNEDIHYSELVKAVSNYDATKLSWEYKLESLEHALLEVNSTSQLEVSKK